MEDEKYYIRCENHCGDGLGAVYDFVDMFLMLPNPQGVVPTEERFYDDEALYDIYHEDGKDRMPIKTYDAFMEAAAAAHANFDPETFNKPTIRVQRIGTDKVWDHITMRDFVELMIGYPPIDFKYAFSPIGLV